MNLDKFLALADARVKQRMDLLRKKGQDYATDTDKLANGKRLHQLCKLLDIRPADRPEDTFFFLLMLKIDRDRNLVRENKPPENESRQDTLQDLRNYVDLYEAMQLDVTEQPGYDKYTHAIVDPQEVAKAKDGISGNFYLVSLNEKDAHWDSRTDQRIKGHYSYLAYSPGIEHKSRGTWEARKPGAADTDTRIFLGGAIFVDLDQPIGGIDARD